MSGGAGHISDPSLPLTHSTEQYPGTSTRLLFEAVLQSVAGFERFMMAIRTVPKYEARL